MEFDCRCIPRKWNKRHEPAGGCLELAKISLDFPNEPLRIARKRWSRLCRLRIRFLSDDSSIAIEIGLQFNKARVENSCRCLRNCDGQRRVGHSGPQEMDSGVRQTGTKVVRFDGSGDFDFIPNVQERALGVWYRNAPSGILDVQDRIGQNYDAAGGYDRILVGSRQEEIPQWFDWTKTCLSSGWTLCVM